MATLEQDIKQKHFKSEYLKADVNLHYTYSYFLGMKNSILKQYKISLSQFNILRILKGQKGAPASIKLLSERMIDKMSNASRLVEKLRTKGYVERRECCDDRRQVEIYITKSGLDLIAEASNDLEVAINERKSITEEEARELNRILNKMRG